MVLCFLSHSQPSISFQFDCTNTLNDQLLENVNVLVEGEGWAVQVSLPCPSLPYSQLGSCYTLLPIPEDIMATTGKTDRERVNSSAQRNETCLFSFYFPLIFLLVS